MVAPALIAAGARFLGSSALALFKKKAKKLAGPIATGIGTVLAPAAGAYLGGRQPPSLPRPGLPRPPGRMPPRMPAGQAAAYGEYMPYRRRRRRGFTPRDISQAKRIIRMLKDIEHVARSPVRKR